MNAISILFVLTSASQIAPSEPTGLWLEEFAVPYNTFQQQGYHISVASVEGGEVPIDPRSQPDEQQQPAWSQAMQQLKNTRKLADINTSDYDAVFLPGGHGTMFDLPDNATLKQLLRDYASEQKVIAAVCHGPAGLVEATLEDGSPLVAGKTLTAFTNAEENEVGLSEQMPFLLETRLKELGANFVEQPNWTDHVQVDGYLITGQNPQSSESAAKAVIKVLSATTQK